jgi:hypothetical protein
VEPLLLPWVRREYRRRRRDRAIVACRRYYLQLGSGQAIAAAMAKDLRCFRTRPFPETGKCLLLASIIELKGKPLGETAIREVLAGKSRDYKFQHAQAHAEACSLVPSTGRDRAPSGNGQPRRV